MSTNGVNSIKPTVQKTDTSAKNVKTSEKKAETSIFDSVKTEQNRDTVKSDSRSAKNDEPKAPFQEGNNLTKEAKPKMVLKG